MGNTDTNMDLDQLKDFFDQGIPFHQVLGLKVDELEPGRCLVRVPYRHELLGDIRRPAMHGGVLSAVADTAGGLAVWSTLSDPKSRVATVDMRVDYLRHAVADDLLCEGIVSRVGNRVAVTSMRLWQGEDRLVAESRGVYNVKRAVRDA